MKSHVQRSINEGHDIKSATDIAGGWLRFLWCKACINNIVKEEESSQDHEAHNV